MLSRISHIQVAIISASFSLKPRVVIAGVPMRKPLVIIGGLGSFGTEFLSLKMAVKTVASFVEAIDHINKYSSKHSEAIISENKENIKKFEKVVDASSVFTNVSTAFTDGAQFGLGAEIGISTQKLHARGPMALEELTSYKWIIEGDGQIRPK